MGVNGFHAFLKRKNVVNFNTPLKKLGTKCAIDVSIWVHQSFNVASGFCFNYESILNYILENISLKIKKLFNNGMETVIIVFDNLKLYEKPSKKLKRENAYHLHHTYFYQTFLYLSKNSELSKNNNFFVIQSPVESDTQMAFLQISKRVDFVITEDSDLLVLNCGKIAFKTKWETLTCDFVDITQVVPLFFNNHMYIILASLFSGCDYTYGVPRMGIIKAVDFFKKNRVKNIKRLEKLKKVDLKTPFERYFNQKVKIYDDFTISFIKSPYFMLLKRGKKK